MVNKLNSSIFLVNLPDKAYTGISLEVLVGEDILRRHSGALTQDVILAEKVLDFKCTLALCLLPDGVIEVFCRVNNEWTDFIPLGSSSLSILTLNNYEEEEIQYLKSIITAIRLLN